MKHVTIQTINESLPWKPPETVEVMFSDGREMQNVSATEMFSQISILSKYKLNVSIATAGHIKEIHIDGIDLGSKFSHSTLNELLADLSAKIPIDEIKKSGTTAFSVDMGKSMGKEGLTSLQELISKKVVSQAELQYLETFKRQIFQLNLKGSEQQKRIFVDDFNSKHTEFPIFFQLVRGSVIVPCIRMEKQRTNSLFVAMGPLNEVGSRDLYTLAPGRYMPRHPDPSQHKNSEGHIDMASFVESATAWFYTVMLVD